MVFFIDEACSRPQPPHLLTNVNYKMVIFLKASLTSTLIVLLSPQQSMRSVEWEAGTLDVVSCLRSVVFTSRKVAESHAKMYDK